MEALEQNGRWIANELARLAKHYPLPPSPNPTEERIAEIVHRFTELPKDERSVVTEGMTLEVSNLLILAFARRMAVLAVRKGSSDMLLDGLVAVVMEGETVDYRDSIVTMSLLCHSARKLSLDADALFRRAASFGTRRASEMIESFLSRSPGDKSIEVMGYKEATTAEGFDYEQVGL